MLHPFGDARRDFGAALVAATLANVNRGKATEPFVPDDFMPLADGPLAPPKKRKHSAAADDASRGLKAFLGSKRKKR